MSGASRVRAATLAALMGLAAAPRAAWAEDGACPILPPLKKVTALAPFLKEVGGVKLEGFGTAGVGFAGFNSDGTFEGGGASYYEGCGDYLTIRGSSGEGTCVMRPMKGGTAGDRLEFSGSLEISAGNAEVMIASASWEIGYSRESRSGAFLRACRTAGSDRTCTWEHTDWRAVQVIPGAKDAALFDAALAALRGRVSDHCTPLFQGPQARTPRSVSEVFYATPDARDQAKGVADRLKAIIGPVEPKPWPGAWLYDVIVVVGDRPAAP
jgi:hypothetical protein